MPRYTLGFGDDSRPRTPTLREYAEEMNNVLPEVSFVRIIFLPTKVPNLSLITDHDFRVNIHRTTDLFHPLLSSLEDYRISEAALLVIPSQTAIGSFDVALDDDYVVRWEKLDWGYKLSEIKPRPQPTKVTRRNRTTAGD